MQNVFAMNALTVSSEQKISHLWDERLSAREQAGLLGLNRSSIYYKKAARCPFEYNDVRKAMREFFLDQPFVGLRKIVEELKERGFKVGRKFVKRLI